MLTLVAAFVATPVLAQTEVVTWKTKVTHVKDDVYRVTFEANIQAGWHIYDLGPYENGPIATTFDFEKNANVELVGKVKPVKPTPRHMDDVWGMEIGYFEGKPGFTQDVKLKGDKATLKGVIEWQSCNDESCLPPGDYEFSIEIVKAAKPVAEAAPATETSGTTTAATAAVAASGDAPAQEDAQAAEETPAEVENSGDESAVTESNDTTAVVNEATDARGGKGLWALIIQAIIWGFVALVTPCVFPMIPVTLSFFLKGSENKAAARFRATSYGLFIVILYVLPIAAIILITRAFGGDGSVAGIFNWLATHWLPNIIFFLIFMVFAASFFGAFEITMPSKLINKSDSKADKGGLVGVFFMALTLVLVSFSCTGPLIGMVLVEAATGSSVWWEPIVIMTAFAVAFALPFAFFAFFPSLLSKFKSGGWLNSVKVSLAFIEVALAFKFLMTADQSYGWNLLPRDLYLAIWIACAALWALYLIGKIKFKHDSDLAYVGTGRIGLAIAVTVFLVWMIPGMWGAPLKALSGYMPPLSSQVFKVATAGDLGSISVSASSDNQAAHGGFINPLTGKAPKYTDFGIHAPEGFSAFFDLKEAEEYAKHVGKPLFIDITGIACVNCREMEQNVWTDPAVAKILREDYVMVCIFLDVKQTLPESDWVEDEKGRIRKQMGQINTEWSRKTYNQVAQPLYVLHDPRDGKMLGPTRAYNKDIAAYVTWLQSGLDAYKKK